MTKGPWTPLVLLAVSLSGIGQQPASGRLEALLAEARTAQSSGNFPAAAADYKQAIALDPGMPELWANLGLMEHQQGKYREAIQSLLEAHRRNPSLYVPNLFLGLDYAHSGEARTAIPYLIRAEKINGSDPQAPLALGRVYVASGNLTGAIRELERAASVDPKLAEAWFALGIAHLEEVESAAREISERGKESSFAGALYAASLQKQGRFGEAASLYKSLLDSHPQPRCLRSELGFSLIRNHDAEGAREAFRAEKSRHPECSLAWLGEAGLAARDGDRPRSVELLQGLWARDPGFVQANGSLLGDFDSGEKPSAMMALLESGESGALPSDLRSALLNSLGDAGSGPSSSASLSAETQAPSSGPLAGSVTHAEEAYQAGHFRECARLLIPAFARLTLPELDLLAACAESTGDERLVMRAADAIRRQAPGSLEALYWSVRANEKLALASLARFQQLDSESARSHVLLGDIYHQLDRNDDAQTEYLKALAARPGDPAALLGLATAYLSNNNLEAAQQAAQAALAADPDDPDMNLIMAEVELGRNEFSRAEPYLARSLRAKPQMQARVHALLGKVYAETGRPEQAIQELKLGASSDEDGSVQYLLSRLYRKLGDAENAKLALDRMKAIKEKRRERGYKLVEDPELSAMEPTSSQAATP